MGKKTVLIVAQTHSEKRFAKQQKTVQMHCMRKAVPK